MGLKYILIFRKHSCLNCTSEEKTWRADKARHRLELEVTLLLSCLFCISESFDTTRIKSSATVILRSYTRFVLALATFLETQLERNL